MKSRILSSEKKSWILAMAVLVFWTLAMAYLIHFYGPSFPLALLDSGIYAALVLGGILLLENVFRFYLPQGSNIWIAFLLPVLLTVLLVSVADYGLKYWMANNLDYLVFLDRSLPVRAAVVLILFSATAVFVVMDGKLEDQINSRKREEMIREMSKEAELYHLRQQLQPHFLFNCLNSISALVKMNPEKAREMVVQLSEFLRKTIRKDHKKWIFLREEVDYLNLFLEIEKVRFGHRLQVDFQIQEESLNCSIPPLLIQPLLENAIKHGLYGSVEEVLIQVIVQPKGDYLEVKVKNPFDTGGSQAEGEGFGLEAIQRRLYLLFGRYDLLKCKSMEQLFSVTLLIPQQHDPDYNH